MNTVRLRVAALALALLAGLVSSVVAAIPPLTYQGQLKFEGVPFNGLADMSFALYDRVTEGTRLCTGEQYDVEVVNGLFTVELNLTGTDCFNGDPRWLEIGVRTPDGSATLDPRQPVSAAPYALYAYDAPGGSSVWGAAGSDIYYQDGNVGVGTSAPNHPLHVVDSSGVPTIVGENRNTATTGKLGTEQAGVYGEGAGSSDAGVYGVAENGFGVKGEASGIYGTGVDGYTISPTGAAIHGQNEAETGNAIAIWGETASPDGFGGYFGGKGYFRDELGVGVTDPAEMLDVAGTIQATGFKLTTAPAAGWVLTSNATGVGTWQPSGGGGSSYWSIDPNNDSIYYGDGYVGVGHGAGQPILYPLHVLGTAAMTGFRLGESAMPGDVLTADANGVGTWQAPPSGGSSLWGDGPEDHIYYSDGFVGIGTGAGQFPAQMLHVVGTGHFGGNLGIGVVNPTARLDVAGTIKMTGFKLTDLAAEGRVLTSDANGYGTWQRPTGRWQAGPDDDIYYGDGKVGVGTGTPAHPLHVVGWTSADPVVLVESTSTADFSSALAAETGANDGRAVYGHATAAASNAAGGYFESDSIYGHGVRGRAEATEGAAIGGFFSANAPDANGVVGRNNSLTGNSVGVKGYTESTSGRAVFGWAAGTEGETYAVYGQTNSPDGFGGYFNGKGYFSGSVGIGVMPDTTPLKVKRASGTGAGPAITGTASGSSVTGVYGFVDDPLNTCFGVRGESSSPAGTGVQGKATADSGTNFGVKGISDSPEGRGVQGQNSHGGWAGFFQGPVLVTSGLGSGPAEPMAELDVEGTVRMTGFELTDSPSTGYVLTSDANGVGTWQPSTGGGSFDLPVDETVDADGQTALRITNTGTGMSTNAIAAVINNTGSAETSAGTFTVVGSGNAITATSDGGYAVYASGDGIAVWGSSSGSGGGSFRSTQDGGYGVKGKASNNGTSPDSRGGWFEASGSQGRGVYAQTTGTQGRAVEAIAEGGEGIGVYVESPWTGVESRSPHIAAKFYGDIRVYDYGTTNTIFHVNDSDGTTTVKVLQIEGGADLAEPFDVGADDIAAEPGMVVSIDPDHVGKLLVSKEPYDSKVAGVISGAGGINPGMVMGQEGSIAHGEHPIALTGRVWTLCDATHAPIKAGDLLTTSETPGHARKVTDFARAQGAIIGKAMSPLAKGERGLVLVLVNLQ